MGLESQFYTWEGKTYRIDLSAAPDERVLLKDGDAFISTPELGKLGATILFEGTIISKTK